MTVLHRDRPPSVREHLHPLRLGGTEIGSVIFHLLGITVKHHRVDGTVRVPVVREADGMIEVLRRQATGGTMIGRVVIITTAPRLLERLHHPQRPR